ncbi:MAG TPA: lipase maturation factor family protein, partial [Myxococcales bacterium]|nr:lipase maturation factor family protein [Myxococcales bacterium]
NRFEIEFQGSNDGVTYVAYPFRYKPQELRAAPGLFAPYQPRFEWNLWFASLSDVAADPWVINAAVRLLQGSPPVLQLFRANPFREKPPRYLRTVLWQYWFTSPAERRRTGAWWKRELRGNYGPELELVSGEVRAR